MFSLLLLIGVCVGYYYLDMYYPRDTKEKIYFGGFIVICIAYIYLSNFHEEFIYKLLFQLKEIQEKPRYDLDFFYKEKEKEYNKYNKILSFN
tara:strand:- start:364 stop:639 length:276 start_codon:yes stop_codon:yes gene_type:complete